MKTSRKMTIKRIFCFAAAAVMSMCAVMPACADDDEEKKVLSEYWENEDMMTDDDSVPTLSFDLSDWKNLLHMTKDASLADLSVKADSKYAYQGQSLKISAYSAKDITGLHRFSWEIYDDDRNLVYPEAAEEDAEYITVGIELHANEFGMNYFDGSMITFNYRINPDAYGLLMDNSVYVYACDDDYGTDNITPCKLQYNDTDSNNTTQYAKGVVSVPQEVGATKLIIEIPLEKATEKIDILYMDNLTIHTQTDKYVANIDGYNENAKAQETVQGLKVKAKENTVDISEAESTGTSVKTIIVYVGIGIVGLAVIVGIILLIRRVKNKFY